ncbi:hypothetical protein ScPMuIL_009366 [Solemya velum]
MASSKAIDILLSSKWASGKSKTDILFPDRKSCVLYCQRLLQKGLFHRATKVERRKEKSKKRRKEEDFEEKERKGKKEKEKKEKEITKTEKAEEIENKEEKKDEGKKKDEEKKKKEKKLKLDMHDDQRFVDGDEIYVWIYDPVPAKTFVIGLLMVLGAAALCLFPLWPDELRIGVYYVSLAGAGFVGFIIVLVIVRLILFCLVWVLTLGKHHFWFLPNLTEDVGVIESFKPLYKHDLCVGKDVESEEKDTKKKTKMIKYKEDDSGSDNIEKEDFEIVDEEDLGEEEQEQEGGEQSQGEVDEEEEVDFDENDLEDEDINIDMKKEN